MIRASILFLAIALLAVAGEARGQTACISVSVGASSDSVTATMINVGQTVIGDAANASYSMHAGVIYCLVAHDSSGGCAHTDVNCDGNTNAADILVIRQGVNWNQAAGAANNPRCDVNADSNCNAADILVIRQGVNWNTSTGPCKCP